MILANPAPRYTRVETNQTASLIASGNTIKVHGIVCSATGTGTVTLLDALGNTIATISLSGGVPFELKTGFVADKGLAITTSAAASCTVFHSNASV